MSKEFNIFKIGLKSERKENKNNFIPSTLHCLMNIGNLTNYILNCDYKDEKNLLFNEYKKLLQNLKQTQEQNKGKYYSIEDFENILFKIFNSENHYNPQYLLEYLIKEFDLFLISEFQKKIISDTFYIYIKKVYHCQICNNYSDEKIIEEKFLIYDLTQYQKENKNFKYNTFDCLLNYGKDDNSDDNIFCKHCENKSRLQSKVIYKTLPKVLIIFVDYGDKEKFSLKNKIEFNEELNLEEIEEKVEINYNQSKYNLSYLICVKEMMKKKEHFYSFCKDEDNYFCYNGDTVYQVLDINNKIDNIEINIENKKQGFPYILMYTLSG